MPPAAPGAASDSEPIFLVGMMGAGKTTIGRLLARQLGCEFLDLDHELEARCGVRVALIFEIEGEDGFRRREAQALDDCTRRKGIVLATGGGAVLDAENRRLLRERGTVVYLRAEAEELFRRLERDRTRPLLQTEDPKSRIRDLLTQREPLYAQVAHVVFDTGAMPAAQATRALIAELEHNPKSA